jgi:hypothetical protein
MLELGTPRKKPAAQDTAWQNVRQALDELALLLCLPLSSGDGNLTRQTDARSAKPMSLLGPRADLEGHQRTEAYSAT